MGNALSDFHPETEVCRCMDENGDRKIATYRCQYFTQRTLTGETPPRYPELRRYWSSTYGPGYDQWGYRYGMWYQYTGCDKCMDKEVRCMFTHHPNGWKEFDRVHIDYEDIVFPHR